METGGALNLKRSEMLPGLMRNRISFADRVLIGLDTGRSQYLRGSPLG
jgi:hypothetical protein